MSGERESVDPKAGGQTLAGTRRLGQHEVTQLLADWSQGDRAALDKLTPLVYEELRRLAHRYMEGQRPDHTLQTTALVNEAYLRLADQKRANFTNRSHFFAVAAKAMRQILVDHAKAAERQKRGGGASKVELDEATLDSRKAQVVELSYFGGLKQEEIAEVLKVSIVTVRRDWVFAKTWLYGQLSGGA